MANDTAALLRQALATQTQVMGVDEAEVAAMATKHNALAATWHLEIDGVAVKVSRQDVWIDSELQRRWSVRPVRSGGLRPPSTDEIRAFNKWIDE